jgi:hypothetical protein
LFAKNSSRSGTGCSAEQPSTVSEATLPGSSTTALEPPTFSYSRMNTLWSGKMLPGSSKMSLNCHSSSSRKHGGPAIGKTCDAFRSSM